MVLVEGWLCLSLENTLRVTNVLDTPNLLILASISLRRER